MSSLAAPAVFDGFGFFRLGSCRPGKPHEIALPGEDSAARQLLRRHCPVVPGVYGMVDAQSELIYVGKSKALRERLFSYFSAQPPQAKARRIAAHTRRLLWEPAPHEFVALLRELELIRRWLPRYNVRGRPRSGHRTYLVLTHGPAPHAILTRSLPPSESRLFGFVPGNRDSQRMVRLVNDCFCLRDCPERVVMHFDDQRELFVQERSPQCIRYDLGTCLGPCAGRCSAGDYRRQTSAAAAFLAGRDAAILRQLDDQMRTAAAGQQFERAALLRNAIADLTALWEHLKRLREVQRAYRFVYPLPGYGRHERWWLVDRGQVIASIVQPRSAAQAARGLEILKSAYSVPPPEDPDLTLLVAGWFRTHPDELARTFSPEEAGRRMKEQLP